MRSGDDDNCLGIYLSLRINEEVEKNRIYLRIVHVIQQNQHLYKQDSSNVLLSKAVEPEKDLQSAPEVQCSHNKSRIDFKDSRR